MRKREIERERERERELKVFDHIEARIEGEVFEIVFSSSGEVVVHAPVVLRFFFLLFGCA